MTFAHPAERGRRGPFERLSERASNLTSSPLFYTFCLLLVGGFIAVNVLGLSLDWKVLVGDAMTAVTLLLLALLKNSERRAEHAIQRKLDAIAAALLEQFEGERHEARDDLRQAIRLDEDI